MSKSCDMYIKKATTIEEQIAILKDRGMTIADEEKAKENLLDIGYFRLGFYCYPFEKDYPQQDNRSHFYREGSNFEDVVKLYYFDYDLRNLLLRYINRIEINFRTYLTYHISNKHKDSPTWFVDPSIMQNKYVNAFENDVYNETFKKTPVIMRHHQHHINDKFAPAWKTIEFMTFGNILKLYNNLKNDISKYEISNYYGIRSVKVFNSYMETIRFIRNTCAHGGALFDITLPRSISNGPAGIFENKQKHNLDGTTNVILYILRQISTNRADDLQLSLNELLQSNKTPKAVMNIIKDCLGYKFS